MEIALLTLPLALEGLKTTALIFIITLAFSLPLGMVVAAIRTLNIKIINSVIFVYVWIMRGTPLLLQLMFIFFGLPYLNITLGRYEAAFIAFILNYTAYFVEIFRGGIDSIDKGQYEASFMLGLSKAYTFLVIIIPQVIKTTFPSVGNEVINLLKDTSLIYILGIGELLKAAKTTANTFGSIMPFITVGLIYLVIAAFLTQALKYTERKINYYE